MENKNSYIALGLILSLGLIISAFILGNTWKKVSRSNVTITVTGSAQKNIRSDFAVWTGTFSVNSSQLQDGYKKLQESAAKVKSYLSSKGFGDDKIKLSSVGTSTIYVLNDKGISTNQIQGYRLNQTVTVSSNDVDKIDLLSREVTELIMEGIEINSEAPEFFYTKLGELKVEMIGLAAKDAKTRADQIAMSTDNKVGEVRSSKMGVIQINPVNSTEISDYGNNDTSSLEKVITAVVTVSYSIE